MNERVSIIPVVYLICIAITFWMVYFFITSASERINPLEKNGELELKSQTSQVLMIR
mgnify:CR=1 FL=1|jgi:uncharacterized membrane protein YwzB